MRVFNRDGKVNFVDENNVFVGYDLNQSCCESAGYILTKQEPLGESYDYNGDISDDSFPGFNFDISYKKESLMIDLDSGGSLTFKLVNDDDGEMFVTIYNAHNGWYSHGFEIMDDGKMIEEGSL